MRMTLRINTSEKRPMHRYARWVIVMGMLALASIASDAQERYSYDAAGRLVSTRARGREIVYRYDPNGNILQTTAAPASIAADPHVTGTTLEAIPNPSRSSTLLLYHLDRPSEVELTITTPLGAIVETRHAVADRGGDHEMHWDAAALPAGIYIATLRARDDQGRVTTAVQLLAVR